MRRTALWSAFVDIDVSHALGLQGHTAPRCSAISLRSLPSSMQLFTWAPFNLTLSTSTWEVRSVCAWFGACVFENLRLLKKTSWPTYLYSDCWNASHDKSNLMSRSLWSLLKWLYEEVTAVVTVSLIKKSRFIFLFVCLIWSGIVFFLFVCLFVFEIVLFCVGEVLIFYWLFFCCWKLFCETVMLLINNNNDTKLKINNNDNMDLVRDLSVDC